MHPLLAILGLLFLLLRMNAQRKSRRIIMSAGLFTVMSTMRVWTLLIWAGWSLTFNASCPPSALIVTMPRLIRPSNEN